MNDVAPVAGYMQIIVASFLFKQALFAEIKNLSSSLLTRDVSVMYAVFMDFNQEYSCHTSYDWSFFRVDVDFVSEGLLD